MPDLPQAVLARLLTDLDGRKFIEGSRCNEYRACSLRGNLFNASGEELEMYFREKEEDGLLFEGFRLGNVEQKLVGFRYYCLNLSVGSAVQWAVCSGIEPPVPPQS